MNFDPKILEQLKNMDQKELTERINALANAMGIDKERINAVIGDGTDLREGLNKLSDEDIRRMTKKADPRVIESIKKNMMGG